MARPNAATIPLDAPPPAPRFAALWAAFVYVGATLTLAYPALGGAFLVNPRSDQYIAGYAFREFAAQWLRSGRGFPEWNPYLFGGLPYVAAMHGDIFYPTFLLRMVLPTDQAMTWEFPIHLVLAGLFTYGLLRAWNFGFFPSLVGGLAYLLSGQIASLVSPGHDGKLFVSALFPLALWFLTRGVRDGRLWAWGGLAVAVGLAVLSPHPQLFQYMLLGSGAFALYAAFGTYENVRLERPVAIRRLAFALGAVVLGCAIGAVQYLPVFTEYYKYSPRAGGTSYEFATSFSMPWEELLVNTYLPQFTGILGKYWGRNNFHFHSEYLGVVTLFLAGAAFGAGGGAEQWRGFRRFWFGALIVAAIWALGGNTPIYHLLYAIPPLGAKFFRAPSTIFFVAAFAVAVLAAVGTERLLAGAVSRRYAIGWLVGGGVLALLGVTGALTNLATSIAQPIGARIATMQQAAASAGIQAWTDKVASNSSDLLVGSLRTLFFVVLAAGLVLARQRRVIGARALAWGIVALVGADLWTIDRLYWLFSPPARILYAPDAIVEYIKKQPEPGRVLVWTPDENGIVHPDPYFGAHGGGEGTGLMVHGIRSVTGYQGNAIARYEALTQASPDGRIPAILTPAFWRLENTQYLYTSLPDTTITLIGKQLALSEPFVKVAGPVKNSAGSTAYLYRTPGRNPLAWIAPIMVKASDEQALPTVLNAGFDPTRAAIVDPAAPVQSVQVQALPPAAGTNVSVRHYEPGAMTLALDQPALDGQALVVSENYFPGWRATADGAPATVARMDFNLVGVALPKGARSIELRFEDAAYGTGKRVTLIALLVALTLWVGGAVAGSRRHHPKESVS
jgi:hypothetical protein